MKSSFVYLAVLFTAKVFPQASVSQLSVIKEKAQAFMQQQLAQNTQATIASLKDSTYYYSWYISAGQWAQPSRIIYGYNTAGKENSFVNASIFSGNWQDINRQVNYTFDVNTNLLSYESQKWNFPGWVNNQKKTYTYDNADNQLTELVQTWNSSTSSWVNYSYVMNTYDVNQNLLSSVNQVWLTGTASWLNSSKETSTYSTNNQCISRAFQSWNNTGSNWETTYQYANFIYTNGDLTGFEGQAYDGNTSAFVTVYKVANTYDGSHHLLNTTSKELNFNTMTWENVDKDDYTYDTDDNQITYLRQKWNPATNAWGNQFRQFDYYSYKTVGLNSKSEQESLASLYPTPAKGELTINSNTVITRINVIDVAGKIVLTEAAANNSSVKLDVSTLPQGMYVVEIKSGNATAYKKMIKD